ncbi:MAG TPA: hypothetical protein DCS07_10845 [Bdellovibrionales bacterium]|nr:MAG: hypothetical protein A2Z97_07630 [Bdellovibrionales bacterium GWB1_52_6]OFZ04749.1 MAG: hypothetical protein A2X97_13570 [Bdellovibrionales bacterium GWA1_52_35]OFZ38175.1 MAG: hypothetical protein A2070_01295 [Bdellovibrionales bacterium GWC1_52_8]HAR43106.1 hypothetical protein [Bdellovibrionales bacterium]HCM39563.1 hypothetical protein [Bdellovibrionales bacterium]
MRKNFKGVLNLVYIEVKNVPVEKSERWGAVMSAEVSGWVERMVGRAILEQGVPLRGAEVQYLREVIGMSQRQLGNLLGYSGVAILKWERAKSKRLDRVNEIAVRALMAEKFAAMIDTSWAGLLGTDEFPKKLVVDFRSYEDEFKDAA